MSEIHGVFVDITAVAVNRRCWAECSLPSAGIHTHRSGYHGDSMAQQRRGALCKCLVLIAMQTGEAVAGRHKICDESIWEQRRQQS